MLKTFFYRGFVASVVMTAMPFLGIVLLAIFQLIYNGLGNGYYSLPMSGDQLADLFVGLMLLFALMTGIFYLGFIGVKK